MTGRPRDCTCSTPPTSGGPHAPDCPITPRRDAALLAAARAMADIRRTAPAKRSA